MQSERRGETRRHAVHNDGPRYADVARTDPHLREAHPGVPFRALNGAPLCYSKHSWNGLNGRRTLLLRGGIVVPDDLPGSSRAAPDDVVDAAVAAWSAVPIAERRSKTLPAVASTDPARGGAIHCPPLATAGA